MAFSTSELASAFGIAIDTTALALQNSQYTINEHLVSNPRAAEETMTVTAFSRYQRPNIQFESLDFYVLSLIVSASHCHCSKFPNTLDFCCHHSLPALLYSIIFISLPYSIIFISLPLCSSSLSSHLITFFFLPNGLNEAPFLGLIRSLPLTLTLIVSKRRSHLKQEEIQPD